MPSWSPSQKNMSQTNNRKTLWRICWRTLLFYFFIGFICGVSGIILAFVLNLDSSIVASVLFLIVGMPMTFLVYKMLLSIKLNGTPIQNLLVKQ